MDKIPIAKYDQKGRIVCPVCRPVLQVPVDSFLGKGMASCKAGHQFWISDDVQYAVNDILKKSNEHRWRGEVLKEFEETPEAIRKETEGGSILLP